MRPEPDLVIIGGGLAGSEAAWQAAERGARVRLYEMRPLQTTGAHVTGYLAELVCSNSLGSNLPDRASGALKEELRKLNSLLLRCAETSAVPAGRALAVDRNLFAQRVTEALTFHPRIEIIRQEISAIPDITTIIASGPLTSSKLAEAIQGLTGQDNLYFFDAIAPIISEESINMSIAFKASRYDLGEERRDYINCPLDEGQYHALVEALVNADRIPLRSFEEALTRGVRTGKHRFFEGCLPIEVLAQRGEKALAYGPLRPVGIINPHDGKTPYAVVQLRQDNKIGTLFNLVGFQTNLKYSEQEKIIRMIPGLEKAEIVRYGQMHRNTFIFSPALLNPALQFRWRQNLFFAGQITGVEGYTESIATGLLAGLNAYRFVKGKPLIVLPKETMLGALCHYITQASPADFQPMKANMSILPPLEDKSIRGKRNRAIAYAERALSALNKFLEVLDDD